MGPQARAIVFTEPGRVELAPIELAPCGQDEVIAETLYTFVSPGTELRVLAGRSESKGKFPLIPGYAWVGRVIEIGPDVQGWAEGELVTGRNPLPVPGTHALWGGQASHHRAPVSGYDSVLKLPDGADPWDYVPVEVAAISWRGTSIAYPARGETAVVIGQGLIGTFAAKWLLYHGARVIVTDLEATRLARARRWGVAGAINGREPDARARILALCEGGADVVIEASSSMAGVRLASSLVRQPWPRVMNTAYPVAAMHSDAHLWARVVYLATYTDTIAAGPGAFTGAEGAVVLKPGDRTVGDRLAVIERIREGTLTVADIIDAPVPVDEAPDAYADLRDHPERHSSLAFRWVGA